MFYIEAKREDNRAAYQKVIYIFRLNSSEDQLEVEEHIVEIDAVLNFSQGEPDPRPKLVLWILENKGIETYSVSYEVTPGRIGQAIEVVKADILKVLLDPQLVKLDMQGSYEVHL